MYKYDISAKNLIKIGTITGIYEQKGYVQVTFEDCDDMPVDMPLLSFEYNMPHLNDVVWCIFQGNSRTSGLCLGRAYSSNNTPMETDKRIYKKPLCRNIDEAFYEYNTTTKTLRLKAENIIFDCDKAQSTGELGDKKHFISTDRTIYNQHSNGNNGANPPIPQM